MWPELLGRHLSADEPRLWLPLRMGGCGAASARARMFAAPWAAWSAVSADLVSHMGCRDVEQLFVKVPPLAVRLARLLDFAILWLYCPNFGQLPLTEQFDFSCS